ncbi:MAG: hypothetical protein IPH68_05790 [Chitinophagaceae bacterium]|nr:hypothetical protein [Chitinophagaceae bacterium]HQW91517.1 hypothetical protein [Ferruginibacter sp.]
MKKIMLFTVIMLFTLLQAKAQTENPETVNTGITLHNSYGVTNHNPAITFTKSRGYNGPVKDYNYYTDKKKKLLTAGLVTLGGGLLLSGVGLLSASNSNSFDTDATAAVLLIAGAAAGIASIPLMIMSGVYAHKAKLELRKQKTGFGVPSNVDKYITGITMTIPIGK